jgi:transcriptional regulator with XRE-family HTH domain
VDYLLRSENRSALHLKGLRSPTARAVATVLAEARKGEGLTQRDLAKRLDRPHSVIGMIESEERQVTVPEFIRLAEAIGRDPIELFRSIMKRRGA